MSLYMTDNSVVPEAPPALALPALVASLRQALEGRHNTAGGAGHSDSLSLARNLRQPIEAAIAEQLAVPPPIPPVTVPPPIPPASITVPQNQGETRLAGDARPAGDARLAGISNSEGARGRVGEEEAEQHPGGDARPPITYRKKPMQSKFSRRRYIRDCNKANLLGLILLGVVFVSVNGAVIFVNTAFLIPETLVNQQMGAESQSLADRITVDSQSLSQLAKQRQQIDAQISTALNNFPQISQIREDFGGFIARLNSDANTTITSQSISESPSNLAGSLANISTLSVQLELETTFLTWLAIRNEFIREIGAITITDEEIIAPPGSNRIRVSITLAKPGRLN